MRIGHFIVGLMFVLVSGGATAQPTRITAPAAPMTQIQALCKWLCGKSWTLTFKNAVGTETRVTYTYQLDDLGTVLEGRGYFVPGGGQPWIDRHYFMADPDNGRVRYVGVSPKAGMSTGTVSLRYDGFTVLVSQLNQPQQFGRLVYQFPDLRTHVISIYQSEDGFVKPSAVITIKR